MLRLPLLLSLALCAVAPAHAAQSSSSPRSGLLPEVKKAFHQPRQEAKANTGLDLVINQQTEIRLNGRGCRYEDIPANASVNLLEVGADRRTVLRIHFQTEK
jgi:hypothetical protein